MPLTESSLDDEDFIIEDDADDIKKTLDLALRVALKNKKHGKKKWINCMFVGEAGTGKTARIGQWAEERDVQLFSLKTGLLDPTDLGGAIAPDLETQTVKRFSTAELDALEAERSVLFLDEFNRGRTDVRQTLLTLINDHKIPDVRVKGGERYLPNMLFTVAAINQQDYEDMSDSGYSVIPMDRAERNRFGIYHVAQNKKAWLNWYKKEMRKERDQCIADGDLDDAAAAEGKYDMAKILILSPQFDFDNDKQVRSTDDDQTNFLSSRSFEAVLEASEGTKMGLIDQWESYCGVRTLGTVESLLKNYVDVADRANAALEDHETESNIFKSKDDPMSKLRGRGVIGQRA